MKIIDNVNDKLAIWAKDKFVQIFIFNLIIIILFLLRSAGYFSPYFTINVNFIVIVGLVLSIILLGATSRIILMASLVFWIFAGLLLVFKLGVWAERTAVYTYESLVVAMILFFIESIKDSEK